MLFSELTSQPRIDLKEDESILLISPMDNELDSNALNHYLGFLPARLQQEVNKYRRWEDKQNSLFGKLLVYSGYYLLSHQKLNFNAFRKDLYGKPFLTGEEYQFNISHTANMVVCVFSKKSVGVDVEQIREIDASVFTTVFSWEEMQDIGRDGILKFYQYWTTKEAVAKALGKGVSIPFINIRMADDHATFSDISWFTHHWVSKNNYCTVVTKCAGEKTIINEVNF